MEYLEGQTLAARLQKGRLPIDLTLRYATEVADALDVSHRRGIVHRDIKPGNIFITTHGETKVLDFGLAKLGERQAEADTATDTMLSTPGAAMGTVAYMSPEQARGQVADARSDLWSLGVVLYEMVTGAQPFTGPTAAVVFEAILSKAPGPAHELNPQVDPELERIIGKLLEKDRASRYHSAASLRSDLQQLEKNGKSEDHASPRSVLGLVRRFSEAPNKKRFAIVASAAVLLGAVAAAALHYPLRGRHRLTDKDTVVIADFANSTGDAVFDDTLKTALTVALNQSPFLNVLADARAAETLKLMTRPVGTPLTADVAREICQRTSSKATIGGTIANLGKQYVLGLTAVNCQTGDTLAQEQVTADAKEKVLTALGETASKMRGELGESLATVRKFDVPLAEATTSSLEALKAYSLGGKAYSLGGKTGRGRGGGAGLGYYQRAIVLDPGFAMAYAALGGEYYSLGELGRATEYYTKAFELREHVSELEKLKISIDYYSGTGQLEKVAQSCQDMIASYPRSPNFYVCVVNAYMGLGQHERAKELLRQVQPLFPDRDYISGDLAYELLISHHFDEARQMLQEVQARDESYVWHNCLYGLAFLTADAAAMAREQQWFASRPNVENEWLTLESDTAAYNGHIAKARELTKRAATSAVRADVKELGAIWWENAAIREAAFGYNTESRPAASAGLKLDAAIPSVAVEASLAYAMAGDSGKAEALVRDIDRLHPLDTQIQSIWLPAIRAQLALNRQSPAQALDNLQAALPPIEYGGIVFVANFSCLYTAYIRGEANLAAGQGTAAAAEFQKVLDHGGLVWNCWTGALARLGVARANTLAARNAHGADADAARARAIAAYKDFLALWKDADPDLAPLIQARKEYAALQ
jgi:tetratricopeptide (TPR) repeat protein